MITHQVQLGIAARVWLAVFVLSCCGLGVSASEDLVLANGLQVRIHGAQEILANDGLLATAVGGPVLLQDDVAAWYPFDESEVLSALIDMRGFHTTVAVDVYILPAPPLVGGRSWSSRNAIFLVPGFGPVAPQTVAYITTHEMGHVLTWACMDDYPHRWSAYLLKRGLESARGDTDLPHAWLPREILAEDFRFLFGGALATATRSIENHDLATPDQVSGLRDLLGGFLESRPEVVSIVRSCAYPNPCNPRTTIRMSLPDDMGAGGMTELRIFDLRGRLVRKLTSDRSGPGAVEIVWDGQDRQGGTVSSGRYLYVMKAGGLTARGAVTLVR
ncbi:hypothetical protein DRQ50_13865 [bacterium]|nr:MAG: hypothetical protein DRQ50_13865 [bacterium]